jgi:hypothetical protein
LNTKKAQTQDSPAVFDILLCDKLTAAVKQLRDSNGYEAQKALVFA